MSDRDPLCCRSSHPLISHVTPAFVARPELLPGPLPLHSTPIIEAAAPAPGHGDEDGGHQEPDRDKDRFHLEPDRFEARHASISHSLSGGVTNLSLPHSGDRRTLPRLS